jgi:hypothetical protein
MTVWPHGDDIMNGGGYVSIICVARSCTDVVAQTVSSAAGGPYRWRVVIVGTSRIVMAGNEICCIPSPTTFVLFSPDRKFTVDGNDAMGWEVMTPWTAGGALHHIVPAS